VQDFERLLIVQLHAVYSSYSQLSCGRDNFQQRTSISLEIFSKIIRATLSVTYINGARLREVADSAAADKIQQSPSAITYIAELSTKTDALVHIPRLQHSTVA
jgi:hypothetical protein